MIKNLKSIASKLSEQDLQELIRLKKMDDKRVIALRKKRDKLAADLAKLDSQIARLTGDGEAAPKKRGRKPSKKTASATAEAKPKAKKKAGARRGRKAARTNLSAAVREVFGKAGTPLKASQVVDALPAEGIKITDVADMRKRISVVLASQKNHFEQVERGLYRLKG